MFSRLFKCCNANSNIELPDNKNTNEKPNVEKPKEEKPKEETKKIQWSDTLQFIPPINSGQVIKVYDGDTFTLAGYLPYDGSPLFRFSVRLNGIDCAEIKGKTEAEKASAIKARDQLSALIMGKTVTLKNLKNEKYGRLLADVYVEELHVNQYMLDNGLAVVYDGGTKSTF
jgi:micrococcal nuclease